MDQGLQVFDASGNLRFGTSSSLGRFLGSTDVSAGSSGSITDANLSTGTPFCIILPTAFPSNWYTVGIPPTVTFQGTTMSWSFQTATAGAEQLGAILIYGTY